MSETSSGALGAEGARTGAVRKDRPTDGKKPGFFGRIVRFVREVVAELKKVVTPTRSELITYTTVVIVFVLVVMAFVTVVDFVAGRAVLWTFGE